jgi:hypothetical protein
MRFTACGCLPVYYQRERRSAWMKLIDSRRLYRCVACESLLFIRPVAEAKDFEDSTPDKPESPPPAEDDPKAKPA